MRIGVSVSIEIPRPANFLRYDDDKTIDVADLPDADLARIGDAMKEALIENAKKRRETRAKEPKP